MRTSEHVKYEMSRKVRCHADQTTQRWSRGAPHQKQGRSADMLRGSHGSPRALGTRLGRLVTRVSIDRGWMNRPRNRPDKRSIKTSVASGPSHVGLGTGFRSFRSIGKPQCQRSNGD